MFICLLKLFGFSSTNSSRSIDNLDVQLEGTFNDGDSLSSTHIVSNLGSVGTVVHKEKLKVRDIGNGEFFKSRGEEVTSLGVGSITNFGHGNLTLESSTDSVINTFGFSP